MQKKMPVVEMLITWAGKGRCRMHMPGHKGGKGLRHVPGFDALAFDTTELPETDDLFAPSGALKEAMELAAEGFGARYTQFLTAGATSGILAMLLALPRGSAVLAGRDCHRSVAAGIELAGLTPVFVYPRMLSGGMPGCVCAEDIESALRKNRHIRAIIITYPNYYGLCGDLERIREAADRLGALLLVDGAHGTHFACGAPALPLYAGQYADVWVDGAHKTTGAMGQGAFLHMSARAEEKGMAKESLLRALALVHTSSPSYPILASLDAARQRLFTRGEEWETFAHACVAVTEEIDALKGLACSCLHHRNQAGVAAHDPTRLVVDVRGRGLTGYAAEPILKAAGVEPEMCDDARIVGIAAPWDPDGLPAFAKAVAALEPAGEPLQLEGTTLRPIAPVRMEQTTRAVEHVEIKSAENRVAAAAVGAYPPGIPVLWPYEVVGREAVRYLLKVQECGGRLFGLQDGKLPVFALGPDI
ncbi:MAG: aminotransferase class I/II-fold pyridoxal phosphate-dependent enzyme [Bacillota bacterium]